MNMSMICALALIMAPAIVTADPQPAAPAPEAVVQAQVEAYNARNIDAFLATYTDDVQVFEHPGKLLVSGATQMRERYTARFKEPNLHATILKRIVMGNYVIDHERVRRTFDDGTGTLDAVAIFEVQGTKIARVWLISGPKALDAK
jgi:hypothetical protein